MSKDNYTLPNSEQATHSGTPKETNHTAAENKDDDQDFQEVNLERGLNPFGKN